MFGELLQSRLAVTGEKPAGGVVAAVTAAVTAATAGGGERELQPAFYFQVRDGCFFNVIRCPVFGGVDRSSLSV